MLKKIEAVVRTSEFWAFVAQVVIQAVSVPVPQDVKDAGWVYIGCRIVSKLVKYKPAVPVAALLLMLLGPPGKAQAATSPAPAGGVSKRLSLTANGGAMVITTEPNWSGASLGGTVLYNLHPKLSVFGGYDHGFPVRKNESHLNLYRAVGSLHVLPDAFVGFGYAWFDKHTDGALAQIILTKQVMPRVAVGGLYAHVMSRNGADFEYVRAYVNYHLFGKE